MEPTLKFLIHTRFGVYVAEDYAPSHETATNVFPVDPNTCKITGECHPTVYLHGDFMVARLSDKATETYNRVNKVTQNPDTVKLGTFFTPR